MGMHTSGLPYEIGAWDFSVGGYNGASTSFTDQSPTGNALNWPVVTGAPVFNTRASLPCTDMDGTWLGRLPYMLPVWTIILVVVNDMLGGDECIPIISFISDVSINDHNSQTFITTPTTELATALLLNAGTPNTVERLDFSGTNATTNLSTNGVPSVIVIANAPASNLRRMQINGGTWIQTSQPAFTEVERSRAWDLGYVPTAYASGSYASLYEGHIFAADLFSTQPTALAAYVASLIAAYP